MITWKLTISQKHRDEKLAWDYTKDIIVCHENLLTVAQFVDEFEGLFGKNNISYNIESVEEGEEDE